MRGPRGLSGAAALVLGALLAGPVQAQDRVGVRVGDHPSFGRVVFDWPGNVGYRVEESAGRVVLHFASPAAFDLTTLRRPPRNVLGVTTAADSAEIRLAPGATMRHFRLGNRVVVDVLDAGRTEFGAPGGRPEPAPRSAPQAAPRPAAAVEGRAQAGAPSQSLRSPSLPSQSGPSQSGPSQVAPSQAVPTRAAPSPARASPSVGSPFQPATPPPAEAPVIVAAAPLAPVQAEPRPIAAVQPAPPPAASPASARIVAAPTPATTLPPAESQRPIMVRLQPGPVISIAAPAQVGAALFRRGGIWMLVLDAPLPLDLAALRGNPALAAAEASTGPEATTLRLPAASLPTPRLRRDGTAWVLDQPAGEAGLRGILPEIEAGPPARLLLRAEQAGGNVSVLDPETGTALLVGTVRGGAEAVTHGRRAALFELLPTRLGAVILPRADTVTLRALPGRFLAGAAAGAELALGPDMPAAAAAAMSMTRSFDLPAESLAGLQERVRNATSAVAAAAPLSRGAPRLQVAEGLLALGLPQEAQAMVMLALREDPVLAEQPRARALHGATALLGGRLAEAVGLDHPGLPQTDEIALWRGLLAAARGQEAAPAVAAGLPLLLSYPAPLQARLAPLAAEALAAGGEAEAARRLLASRDQSDPSLALALARVLEAEGAVEPALAAYDALSRGRDRRARAIAMRRAAELRLAKGLLDAAGAAAALEATLAAWRGDALETEGRSRLAELRMLAGDARGAFDLLRETAAMFPDLAPGLRTRQVEALLGALDRSPPLAAVVLYDAHADMLPPGEATEQALGSLAERLAALDLLDRASHVLRGAVQRAPDAEARGRIGARLAGLALGAGDAGGALKALEETDGMRLSTDLTRSRLLLKARAQARAGKADEAVASYREAGPAAAAELAVLLEEKQDWAGAAAALRQHLASVAPRAPAPLEEAHKPIVARIAALLTLAGDESGLSELRAEEQARMSDGPLSGTFDLLTADRVAGLADLPRLRQELDVARRLPGRLDGLRAETPITR
ncbi:hypothetical protein [Falsiroseomonas sp.]|uniref:hypothetical protein n=1 Tax=Falsiroseomonas sp. TaxID=2870721 RepID=UPI002732ED1C|nr:hypothetical protein [Falsiroseomonas sp.]MDP3414842.1 hypothetical protein [Falsiroseomonas sp.]